MWSIRNNSTVAVAARVALVAAAVLLAACGRSAGPGPQSSPEREHPAPVTAHGNESTNRPTNETSTGSTAAADPRLSPEAASHQSGADGSTPAANHPSDTSTHNHQQATSDLTAALMATLGREALSQLLARPGRAVATVTADAQAARDGLASARIEVVDLPRPLRLTDGTRIEQVHRVVIEGDLPTASYPLQVWSDEQPLGILHEIDGAWVAATADPTAVAPGRRLAIGSGPDGIDTGFAAPLTAINEDQK